jgi:imidazole glycerol-phosphate synthase subunit HisH
MITVVDSGVANLESVTAALARLGVEAKVSANAQDIQTAERVILPGVGAAAAAMERLRQKELVDVLRGLTQPVLGICLGMQLLFDQSEESGGVACLGVLPGTVKLLPSTPDEPVPHMGWNQLSLRAPEHALVKGIDENAYVYFVHSYAAPVDSLTIASTLYSAAFTAIAARGNFMGCQFHPERSGIVGSRILRNFLEL